MHAMHSNYSFLLSAHIPSVSINVTPSLLPRLMTFSFVTHSVRPRLAMMPLN